MVGRQWPFLISLAVIAADRLSKHWIETRFQPWDVVSVIPGLFQIVHTRNTGIAFGMLGGSGEAGRWALIVFALAVMALVISLLWSIYKNGLRVWLRNVGLNLGTAGELLLFLVRRQNFVFEAIAEQTDQSATLWHDIERSTLQVQINAQSPAIFSAGIQPSIAA